MAAACDYDQENEVSAYAEQIANLLPFPMAMQAAIELDLFQIIALAEETGGRISAAEIAEGLAAADKEGAADKLDRMLRLLAAFAVLTCSVDEDGRRLYGLAPVGRYFIQGDDGASFGPLLAFHQDQVFINSWRKLKDAIIEGGVPCIKAHGMNLFECTRVDPTFNHLFSQAMFNHTSVVMKHILRHYKGFDNLKQLVDVGGGIGHTLKIILSHYPMLKGINFDLPHVVDHGIAFPGMEHVGGDMFDSVPSPTEAIFMKWMLHGFSDENCMKLLKNCYNALSSCGKVIVVEHLLENVGTETTTTTTTTTTAKAVLLMDVLMMAQSPNGRERTKQEFTALAIAAGFSTINFATYVCNFCVMEFCK